MIGTIKTIITARGFCFLDTERGDVFLHAKNLRNINFEALEVGQTFEFTLGEDRGRECAVDAYATS